MRTPAIRASIPATLATRGSTSRAACPTNWIARGRTFRTWTAECCCLCAFVCEFVSASASIQAAGYTPNGLIGEYFWSRRVRAHYRPSDRRYLDSLRCAGLFERITAAAHLAVAGRCEANHVFKSYCVRSATVLGVYAMTKGRRTSKPSYPPHGALKPVKGGVVRSLQVIARSVPDLLRESLG